MARSAAGGARDELQRAVARRQHWTSRAGKRGRQLPLHAGHPGTHVDRDCASGRRPTQRAAQGSVAVWLGLRTATDIAALYALEPLPTLREWGGRADELRAAIMTRFYNETQRSWGLSGVNASVRGASWFLYPAEVRACEQRRPVARCDWLPFRWCARTRRRPWTRRLRLLPPSAECERRSALT
jgi:hypothetical protein